jgi:hypothetical protein
MTYDPQREIARFAMRNESFARANDFNVYRIASETGRFASQNSRSVFLSVALSAAGTALVRARQFSFAWAPVPADFRRGLREPRRRRRGFRS